MTIARQQKIKGVTLIEVMVAALAVMVIVVGVMSYQYFCALDARKADIRATGGRLGLLLLEGWKGRGGLDSFNAVDQLGSDLDIALAASGPSGLPTPVSICRIKVEGVNYFVRLSYQDYPPNPPATKALRLLNATVAWNRKFNTGSLETNYDSVTFFKYANY